jgi:hypothetical protein
MDVWHKELQDLNARYTLISGTGPERYERAIITIDEFLK